MKPKWEDAPKWARFLAMDENTEWYWYSHEPETDLSSWVITEGQFRIAQAKAKNQWKKSLEERP